MSERPVGRGGSPVHPLPIVGRFVLHTVVGDVMFGVVGGATVLLNYCADLSAATSVSRYIVAAIQGLEFFLFAADFICLVH